MDGIDSVLVDFSDNHIRLIESNCFPLPDTLKQKLLLLSQNHPQADIDMLGEADTELGKLFAGAVNELLNKTATTPQQILAIGSHGQTIRHQPRSKQPFTMQIGDAHQLSFHTGITSVSDFRRKDIAAGGEGAPLAPAFHLQVFHSPQENRAILNIGGISNLTYIGKNNTCYGFDCGPGNALLDAWIYRHQQQQYDKAGSWASSKQVHTALVERLMSDSFIHETPPKSTGKEHYNLQWLDQQLTEFSELEAAQVQASLSAFTCESIALSIHQHMPDIDRLIICGGGIHNQHLIAQLKSRLSGISIESSEEYGIHPDWVEAIAFAWLARQTIHQKPGNLPEVTGASRPLILGSITPA